MDFSEAGHSLAYCDLPTILVKPCDSLNRKSQPKTESKVQNPSTDFCLQLDVSTVATAHSDVDLNQYQALKSLETKTQLLVTSNQGSPLGG